jgi:hypothetical protein
MKAVMGVKGGGEGRNGATMDSQCKSLAEDTV